MAWSQSYDPLHSQVASTLVAAIPVVVLLGAIAGAKMKAHWAASVSLASALIIAIRVVGMPWKSAMASALYGAAFGFFPIGWIIVNVLFLYTLVEERGLVDVLRQSVATISPDKRLQLLFIAFCLGAFMEGAAGFGTPVAVSGALLMALGFTPLQASGLSLIANTAPVAFGGLGLPLITLSNVTGLDQHVLSAMVGRQLPLFSVIVPFWLIWAYVGFRGMREVWPAILVAGVSFAVPQFLISNYHGPELVDIGSALISMASLALFLRVWHPRGVVVQPNAAPVPGAMRAWTPWIILSVVVFLWGIPPVKDRLKGYTTMTFRVPHLHQFVVKGPPLTEESKAEDAIFKLDWGAATGTAIFISALISGMILGYRPYELLRTYGRTIRAASHSLLTISLMLALGYTTKYAGLDGILGLAFAETGVLYPFFGTMLGWLGVALTGSDTSSNVLFGNLQTLTSRRIGINPILMAAANSSGGVMGKMIDAQSIVVASTVTKYSGKEWEILRYVFWHSLVLAMLVATLVFLQAYVPPFTQMVPLEAPRVAERRERAGRPSDLSPALNHPGHRLMFKLNLPAKQRLVLFTIPD